MSDNTLNPMEIKDYLHLYLGCEAKGWRSEDSIDTVKIDANFLEQSKAFYLKVIPILRPLSDMTEEEKKESFEIYYRDKIQLLAIMDVAHFELCRYLLSKGFDLFGLIDAGLAIKKSH